MNTIRGLIDEVFGLFVDDGSLAIAIITIVAVAAGVSMSFEHATAAIALIIFVGCIAVLIENVLRSARIADREAAP